MTDYEIYSLQSYTDGTQEDLSEEKIQQYIEKIKEKKPNLSKFSDEKILKLNGIIENSNGEIYPTLAGMMAFGEYPQEYLPQNYLLPV